jgi:hypothetical protein
MARPYDYRNTILIFDDDAIREVSSQSATQSRGAWLLALKSSEGPKAGNVRSLSYRLQYLRRPQGAARLRISYRFPEDKSPSARVHACDASDSCHSCFVELIKPASNEVRDEGDIPGRQRAHLIDGRGQRTGRIAIGSQELCDAPPPCGALVSRRNAGVLGEFRRESGPRRCGNVCGRYPPGRGVSNQDAATFVRVSQDGFCFLMPTTASVEQSRLDHKVKAGVSVRAVVEGMQQWDRGLGFSETIRDVCPLVSGFHLVDLGRSFNG